VRTEGGVAYGDVADRVDYGYAARIAGVNAATLAALAWAPPPPAGVRIRPARASAAITWQAVPGPVAGYRVYWRDTIEPFWTWSRCDAGATELTLEGVIADDHLFGVASVGPDGNESAVVLAIPGR
jgi:hypothetical protein